MYHLAALLKITLSSNEVIFCFTKGFFGGIVWDETCRLERLCLCPSGDSVLRFQKVGAFPLDFSGGDVSRLASQEQEDSPDSGAPPPPSSPLELRFAPLHRSDECSLLQ